MTARLPSLPLRSVAVKRGACVTFGVEGKSSERCWAASYGNCSDKLSKEHFVSKAIFKERDLAVKGFEWCKDHFRSVGIASIARKCLCTRHNSMLSEVDDEGVKFFDALDAIAESTSRKTPREHRAPINEQFDGHLLERWFLKTLITLSCGSDFLIGEFGIKPGKPSEYLVEVAYGDTRLVDYMGLYSLVMDGTASRSKRDVRFTPLIKDAEFIAGAIFYVRGIDFFLSLIPAKPPYKLAQLDVKGLPEHILESRLLYRSPKMEWGCNGVPIHAIAVRWE